MQSLVGILTLTPTDIMTATPGTTATVTGLVGVVAKCKAPFVGGEVPEEASDKGHLKAWPRALVSNYIR